MYRQLVQLNPLNSKPATVNQSKNGLEAPSPTPAPTQSQLEHCLQTVAVNLRARKRRQLKIQKTGPHPLKTPPS